MDETYLLVINGKPEGPYTISQLKEMRIKPGDFVRSATMNDYQEAHEVAGLRTALGFAAHPVIPQYFGSFDQRLLASAIDWLLSFAVIIIPVCIAVFVVDGKLVRLILSGSILVLAPIIYVIYHIIAEGSSKQATYGKRLLKIRVCNTDGTPIDYAKATARNFAKIFSVATLGIGYLFSFFNKKQQCLHDIVAGTLVMRDRLV